MSIKPPPIHLKEEDLLHRLHRIEGQIRGLEAMVSRKDLCRDILTQVAAVQGALTKVARMVEACSVAERVMGLAPEAEWDADALQQVIDQAVARQA